MGKFDGILICSDVDGTFRRGEDTVKVNKEAVKYFTDNGGRFTFATGRSVWHLVDTGLSETINAPACLLNGGIIYDYNKNSIIFEKRLDFIFADFFSTINEYTEKIRSIAVFNGCVNGTFYDFEVDNITQDILRVKPIKILVRFDTSCDADEFKDYCLNKKIFTKTYISKSWDVGVEFNNINATKGTAIDYIKKHLGNIHTSIGIGDYDNDIELIRHADIGVAVNNATDKLKQNADFTVKCCEEYAIKDLIEMLDKKY